ncbi:MAG TPA: protein kinase [Pyrinomonadaceae bacterium]|jgi:serine/threonine protein kinase|nr:protein kinase [Pyrinomonadaceae bacterium]
MNARSDLDFLVEVDRLSHDGFRQITVALEKAMLTPGTILQGRYNIVRQLGQGGMGTVYEAVDQRLDTTVALKETFFADERLRKQFEREARLLARLHHPALPRVSDHFSEGEGQFLVMQYIPGDDLSEMMTQKRGPFPADQVLTWADQLLDALDYLHTQEPQIIHRDIKPQNLKLTARGQIILLDFGLAKGQAGEISRVTTAASIFGYTPNYAPLEQIQGLGTDSRSDLYSLAATTYHLLTGTKPPDALTRAASLVNGQPDPLVAATQLNAAVAPEVSHVLQQAMSQNREQRFLSAAEMRKALHRTEQTATVINRGEAQTVLRPPTTPTVAASTLAASTQAVGQQRTVATGETTVVRPLAGGTRRRLFPWLLAASALLVIATIGFGFYMMQKRDDVLVKLESASPSPELSSAPTIEPSVSPDQTLESTPTPAPRPTASESRTPKKAETAAPAEEPKKQSTPQPSNVPHPDTPVQQPSPGHEAEAPGTPDVPRDPTFQTPPRTRVNPKGVPNVRVMPGGVVIRNFPDGSQVISAPDGSRIYVAPDGRRQVLSPPRQRRRPGP